MENIKRILNSDIGLQVEKIDGKKEYNVVDNRFMLLKSVVDSVDNKDKVFYANLISLMSEYIDLAYYESRIEKPEDYKGVVFDKDGQLLPQKKCCTVLEDEFMYLKSVSREANIKLVVSLFDYTCSILEKDKDVVLDISTLTRLLNRDQVILSRLFGLDFVDQNFDFVRLAKIVKENNMLEKANISVGDVYQLLIDTFQLDQGDVVSNLVTPEKFQNNHSKIDELLNECGARYFVNVSNVIVSCLDENFDRLSFIKERNDEMFCGYAIMFLLQSAPYFEKNYELVHEILTDSDIEVDYYVDDGEYLSRYTLGEFIPFHCNKVVLRDFLSNENNLRTFYSCESSQADLFNLYAKVGDYEKALAAFNSSYCYGCDYRGSLDDNGFAFGFTSNRNSLVEFIEDICKSFEEEEVSSDKKKEIINDILVNDRVPYINLDAILPAVQNVLLDKDYKELVDKLVERSSSGNLRFTIVEEQEGFNQPVRIRIASDEEVSQTLSKFVKKGANKVLSKKTNN